MSSDNGKPSIHVIFGGVSPKIWFLLWSIYDYCLLSYTPFPRVMKIGTLGEKSMQIPYIKVNLLSGQLLTMTYKQRGQFR